MGRRPQVCPGHPRVTQSREPKGSPTERLRKCLDKGTKSDEPTGAQICLHFSLQGRRVAPGLGLGSEVGVGRGWLGQLGAGRGLRRGGDRWGAGHLGAGRELRGGGDGSWVN